jgi:hypothetical protein
MSGKKNNEENLYTLIPLEDFKALMGVDDREDKTARFCIVTATLRIEQYCQRKLIRKKHVELVNIFDDLFVPLREYPVSSILAVYFFGTGDRGLGTGEILEPDFYRVTPSCGIDMDLPFAIELSPAVKKLRCKAVKVFYWAGYPVKKIPADLSSACVELASWNLNRYRTKNIGMASNVRGKGREGEHFETSRL